MIGTFLRLFAYFWYFYNMFPGCFAQDFRCFSGDGEKFWRPFEAFISWALYGKPLIILGLSL